VWHALFSPDGKRVAYVLLFERSEETRLVESDGRNDRLLLRDEEVNSAVPAAWSPDGSRIAVRATWKEGRSGLGLLSITNGRVSPVSVSEAAREAKRVVFSRSGKELLFDAPQDRTQSLRDIYAVQLDGTNERRLISDPYDDYLVGLAPDGGRLVFASDLSGSYGIWTAALGAGLAVGKPQLAMAASGRISPLGVTRQGALYYRIDLDFSRVYTAKLDLQARTTISAPKEEGLGMFPSWSRNGELSYLGLREPGRPTLVFLSTRGETRPELPVALSLFARPQWRTRNTVAGFGIGRGLEGFFEINTRTGQSTLLGDYTSLETSFEGVWSADGNVWFNRFQQNRRGLFRFDFRTRKREVLFVPSPTQELGLENLALSPDGRWLAFQVRERPKLETGTLMLLSTDGGDPRPLLAVRRPEIFAYGAFTWLPDSKTLLVARSQNPGGLSQLWLVPTGGAPPAPIGFPAIKIRNLRLSPDGKTIAFHAGEGELSELRILENFLPGR
jgi:dipeptidyl aminopeptidase/acylaminoacyl peptidase